ncbi:hypothetical protein C5167_020530 [Papaver somniferum]|uniref:Uncharacterized protein n=1 Tax=Papaver somniferum TaxID=3469 RepID=A0A4Y7IVD5_PAPSO|nr:hypothetical protein C5167_020530 [Papaver somniferum]
MFILHQLCQETKHVMIHIYVQAYSAEEEIHINNINYLSIKQNNVGGEYSVSLSVQICERKYKGFKVINFDDPTLVRKNSKIDDQVALEVLGSVTLNRVSFGGIRDGVRFDRAVT